MMSDTHLKAAGKLTFIHTVSSLKPLFYQLASEKLSGWQISSIIDESMLGRTIERGYVGPDIVDSLRSHIEAAEIAGSDAIVVTCSTLGGIVDDLARATKTTLFRIDRGMAEQAVQRADTIGILATLPTTLEPTARLVVSAAENAGRQCRTIPRLCEGAFEHLRAGDAALHDEMVREGYEELSREVEIVVLAQASMARALQQGNQPKIPFLTSPELGMDHVAASLSGVHAGRN